MTSGMAGGDRRVAGDVETMRGAVRADDLGRVLMHEHIFVLTPEFVTNYPEHDGFREDVEVPAAIAKLNELAGEGIRTIVDPPVVGLGRDIGRIRRVAADVDLNIVVATGLYLYRDVPHYVRFRGVNGLADLFAGDIEEGIAGTGVKAGVLKCTTDLPGVTGGVGAVLRAAAAAHRATGVPILTHTHAGSRQGIAQQDVFEEEGVDLSRVLIGHSGDSTDLDYLTTVADRGSLLGMDRFGLDTILPFEQRVATVAELCARGYAGSMVLSHDAASFIDWFPTAERQRTTPNWHYLHLSRDVLPELRRRGVTADQLDQMLVTNPRRFLRRGRSRS